MVEWREGGGRDGGVDAWGCQGLDGNLPALFTNIGHAVASTLRRLSPRELPGAVPRNLT